MTEAHRPSARASSPCAPASRRSTPSSTSLAGLDETDVAEHPAVFEGAHEQLRRALDGRLTGSRPTCHRAASGWTPSWSDEAWPAPVSTRAS